MLGPSTFRFLNKTQNITNAENWNDGRLEALWLYNLHYFDDLNAIETDKRSDWHRHLVARWITENTPGQSRGWEPYPISRRVVNWINWALSENALDVDWLSSLAVQTRYLLKRLEWHLLGNHLLANAKALVFAGIFFEGLEADEWRNAGLKILSQELPEQILPDGGHFELSPMYHAMVLEDLLDLFNLASVYAGAVPDEVVDGWTTAARGMHHWLSLMSHPDGEISFFNDAAFGIAAKPAQLEAYARRLGLENREDIAGPVTALRDSGYIRVTRGEMVALLDVAAVGPDYQPGHAHADTLSLELSLFGRRVLVNSGTSQYGPGPERAKQRSTAAHNTLEVDSQDSSEVWAGFRVARRARPFDLEIDETTKGIRVSCAHDGYKRLPGRVVHRRRWNFEGRSLQVTDRVEGRFMKAIARFHIHPSVKAEDHGGNGVLFLPNNKRVEWHVESAEARVVPSRFHPEFGLSIPNACIEVTAAGPAFTTVFAWS